MDEQKQEESEEAPRVSIYKEQQPPYRLIVLLLAIAAIPAPLFIGGDWYWAAIGAGVVIVLVVVSVRFPGSFFSLQEDRRIREKTALENDFLQAMISAGVLEEYGEKESFSLECLGTTPLVFLFTVRFAGITSQEIENAVEQSLLYFNADHAKTVKQGNNTFQITYYDESDLDWLSKTSVPLVL